MERICVIRGRLNISTENWNRIFESKDVMKGLC